MDKGFVPYLTKKVWDVDICSDNHVHHNKYLLSLEYHSWSGKLSMPEEHQRKFLL
jgi:hypothetical protein